MNIRNSSESFTSKRKILNRCKKEIFIGRVKNEKIQPKSKSEINSPAEIRHLPLKELIFSKKSFSRDVTPLSRLIRSEKVSPRGLQLKRIIKPRPRNKSQNLLNIYLNPSPAANSPKFIIHTKAKSCLSDRVRSSPKSLKPNLAKEKENLVNIITKHFKQDICELTTTIKFYKILNLLGQGAFGKVILAVQVLSDIKVAIKVIDKSYLQDDHSRRKVFREIYILKKVKSPYVVKILEFFESDENVFIVMEYMPGGDLLHYLKKNGKIDEGLSKELFGQVLIGAKAIHGCEVLHRDFKLDNILMDRKRKKIKICDFGVSKLMHKGEVITDQCGTPAYLAPEIILDKGYQGYWSDIWSLGVLLYCMVCGTVPFKANNISELNKAILIGRYEFPDCVSQEVKDLIRKMLHSIPKKRISLDNAIQHVWLKDCESLMESDISEKTFRIDPRVIKTIEKYGYSRQYVINAIEYGSLNHAHALYNALINENQNSQIS